MSTEEQKLEIDTCEVEKEDGTRYRITSENRRRMAWVSLYSLVTITIFYTILFVWLIDATPEDKLKHLSDVYFYFAMTMASLVLGYMGSTSISALGVFNKR